MIRSWRIMERPIDAHDRLSAIDPELDGGGGGGSDSDSSIEFAYAFP